MVANFRSYEGQLRLLTAVVAAHPELKLNYKGTSKTATVFTGAIFLLPHLYHLALCLSLSLCLFVKAQSISRLVLTRPETAKHYGSDWTESGIEHFFRPIKKNGKALQEHVRRGEDAKNFTHQAVS